MTDDQNWFAPKRFGYGAGMPIAWQGWVPILGYLALSILAALALIPRHPLVFAAILLAASLVLIPIAARHTKGGWKWRWRGED